jgi:hypothetical protein
VRDPAARDRGVPAEGETRRRGRGSEQAMAIEAQRLLFEEIRAALRTPLIPPLFRKLSQAWPAYLERAWRELKPNVLTRAFEVQADVVRAAAAREAVASGAVAPGALHEALRQRALSAGVVRDICKAVGIAHYLGPKALVAAAALDLALAGQPVGGATDLLPAEREAIAPGVPSEAVDLPLIGDAEAPGRVLRLWNEVVTALGLPGVTDELRVVARWPDFLEIAWAVAWPHVDRPGVGYPGALAEEGARRLPFRLSLSAAAAGQLGLAPAQVADLQRFVGDLRHRLPGLVFTFAVARLGLDEEGGAHAEASPFPI